MPSDYEFRMSEAIQLVQFGVSQAEAARRWNIPRSTLQRRLQGGRTMRKAKEPFQRLSVEQKSFVADWICTEETAGRAPTRGMVREFAEMMLSPGPKLGKRWIDGFFERNPTITTKVGRGLEASRAKEATKDEINTFYGRLRNVVAARNIKTANLCNMDETGVQEGESRAGKVVGSALTKATEVKQSDCTTWATIIEAITAAGARLTPVVIFTGSSLQGQWFPAQIKPWKYDHTPTGWSNASIALRWLLEVYLPETKPSDGSWRLLIIDEHTTHVTVPFMYHAFKNNVQIEYLPPHSSHFTQPLDVGVFSPLKSYYRCQTRPFASYDTSASEQKKRFLQAYAAASAKAICPRNIRAGFRKAGIWPIKTPSAPDSHRLINPFLKPARPPTPPPAVQANANGRVWYTPTSGQQLKQQARRLEGKIEDCKRDFRTLFTKAARALDEQTMQTAALKAENARLKEEIASLKPAPRRTVKRTAQDAFYSIKRIKGAQEAVALARGPLLQSHKKKVRKINSASAATVLKELDKPPT
ncbi:hypothetical protein RB596_008852 [Gaeumannomyces avenae]